MSERSFGGHATKSSLFLCAITKLELCVHTNAGLVCLHRHLDVFHLLSNTEHTFYIYNVHCANDDVVEMDTFVCLSRAMKTNWRVEPVVCLLYTCTVWCCHYEYCIN